MSSQTPVPTTPTAVTLGANFDVLVPRNATAYPIACDEWIRIKARVGRLKDYTWVSQSAGSLLVGVALSTIATIMIGGIDLVRHPNGLAWAWGVVTVAGAAGGLCLFIAHREQQRKIERASDIVEDMELIQKRYDDPLK